MVSFGGPDVGLLFAAGKVRQAGVRLRVAGLDRARAALPAGPAGRDIDLPELDEGMLHWGLLAAATGCRSCPSGPGSARTCSRSTRAEHGALAVRRRRGAGGHARAAARRRAGAQNRADTQATASTWGPTRISTTCFAWPPSGRFVSCERIVASAAMRPPQTLLLNRAMVHGVAETPNGAHFTSCAPDYGRDEAFQARYAAAPATSRPGRSSGPNTWTATRPLTRAAVG